MADNDRDELLRLFDQARKLKSASERERFLDAACQNNHSLRQEVEQLIAAFLRAGEFLDSDESNSTTLGATSDFAAHDIRHEEKWIGPYHLLQKIGEGGMGVVYMAEQTEPVRRRVALKLIRPELGNQRVIARFEAERQALAIMDHPNIAKVLDAGTTQQQIPYFVMELVKGVPITKYCDDHCLSVRERLALMIPIASAVQHAHQKGIIHRDLKPSNILVAEYDDRPTPKVIDFGIAKALNQSLTEGTVFTSFDQIIGTLEYMSPEQANFNQLDIDTRSDVYSLGVVLYELLTGTTPFAADKLRARALDELLRTIREQEPEIPSARLRGSGSLPSLAAARQVPPTRLTTQVRGELDWITMRALEKERARRYESATEFGRDIERYLTDQTVSACPPSLSYRIQKYVRRHRGPVLSGCAILLALTVGGFMWVRATTVARSAYEGEKIAKANAVKQANLAQKNKERAEQAVWDFFMVVSESPELLNLPGTQKLRRKLVGTARDYYTNVLTDSEAWNEYNRGLIWNRLAAMEDDLGNLEQAQSAYQTSLKHWRELHERYPQEPEYANNVGSSTILVARTHAYLGRLKEAELLAADLLPTIESWIEKRPEYVEHHKCLAWLHNLLGLIYTRTDDTHKAEKHFRESIAVAERVLKDDPNELLVLSRIAGDLHNLSVLQFRRRELDAALVSSRASMNYYDKLAELGDGYHQLGNVAGVESLQGKIWTDKGDLASALEMHQSAMQKFNQLAKENPHIPEFREGKAKTHNSLGIIYKRLNRRDEALAEFKRAVAIREPLVQASPKVSEYARELVKNYGNVANSHRELGQAELAVEFAQKALALAEKLEQQDGDTPEHASLLANAYMELGQAQSANQQPAAAMDNFQRGLSTYQQLAEAKPNLPLYQIEFADALRTVGNEWRLHRGDLDQARDYLQQATQHYAPYLSGDTADFGSMGNATLAWTDLADVFSRQGQPNDALLAYQRATEIARSLFANQAAKPETRAVLVACLVNYGLILHGLGNLDEAEELIQEAYVKANELVETVPDPRPIERYLAIARWNLAMVLRDQQQLARAQELYQELLAASTGDDPESLELRLRAHQQLATSLMHSGQVEAAQPHLQQAQKIAERLLNSASPAPASRDLENVFHALATQLAARQQPKQAQPLFRRAIEICEELHENQPDSATLPHFALLCIEAASNAQTLDAEEASKLYERGILALELAYANSPDSLNLARSLGNAFAQLAKFTSSRPDGASQTYLEAMNYYRVVAKHPDATSSDYENLMKTYTNCAITSATQGRISEAIEYYEQAIATTTGDEELPVDRDPLANWRIPALINLGLMLSKGSRADESKKLFEQALQLGTARIAHGEDAPRVHIETAFARINLAELLRHSGELDRAFSELEQAREALLQAISQNTMSSYAFGFLSKALLAERECINIAFGEGQNPETIDLAIDHSREAAAWLERQMRPWPSGHQVYALLAKQRAYMSNALAWQLATDPRESKRDGVEAVVKSTDANRLTNFQSWVYLDTLAAAYAEAGQFDQAIKWQAEAIQLAPESAGDDLRERQRLYTEQQAYHQESKVPEEAGTPANSIPGELEETTPPPITAPGQSDG